MSDFHGYPQHPDAHPERPWWRAVPLDPDDGWRATECALRSDGWRVVLTWEDADERQWGEKMAAALDQRGKIPRVVAQVWRPGCSPGKRLPESEEPITPGAPHDPAIWMARLDREVPLPAPPPRVGQVWVWAEGIPGAPITAPQEAMVGAVSRPAFEDGPLVDWCGGYVAIDRRAPWPPAGAVLVAGAGAPWAPERG
jgi:hypothetical protein